jgi:hypothetical protein
MVAVSPAQANAELNRININDMKRICQVKMLSTYAQEIEHHTMKTYAGVDG